MKKIIISVMLVLVMVSGVLAGCVHKDPHSGQTKLYIGYYSGGMGQEWLDEAIKLFEQKYKDTPFEEGKTGVKIEVDPGKDEYTTSQLLANMRASRDDVFFTGQFVYQDFVKQGLIADITDMVKEEFDTYVNAEGQEVTESIADKMDPYLREYYQLDEKFYALPYQSAVYGIVYDKDLFAEKKLYSDGNGPDGIANTADDGLPVTIEEFKTLINRISAMGYTPFTWAYSQDSYRKNVLNSIWASYEGYDNFNLNYTFDGVWTKPDATKVTIDGTNGYLLQQQEGKKAALKLAEFIMDTTDAQLYSTDAFMSAQSYIAAQDEYVYSTRARAPKKRIAMLFEGGWWENEAKNGIWSEMGIYGEQYQYGNRNFGFMPTPRFLGTEGVADQLSTDNLLYSTQGGTVGVVNNSSTKQELAKLFLQFCHSNEILQLFTTLTGIPKPYDYDLTDTQYESMTSFAKDVWSLWRQENTKVVYNLKASEILRSNGSKFNQWDWGNSDPFLSFYNDKTTPANQKADKYFAGLEQNFKPDANGKWY